MRSVSNFIALMIAVVIAVGVAVAVAVTIPPMLSNNAPKKGVLSIGGTEAVYDSASKTLWIDIRGHYSGAEPATITGTYVLADASGVAGISLSTCYLYVCIDSCPSSSSCRVIYYIINLLILICSSPINTDGMCFFIGAFLCTSIQNVNLIDVTSLTQISTVNPNSYFKISLRSTSQLNSAPTNIAIVITYCFSDGTCYFASDIVPVKTE